MRPVHEGKTIWAADVPERVLACAEGSAHLQATSLGSHAVCVAKVDRCCSGPLPGMWCRAGFRMSVCGSVRILTCRSAVLGW